MLVSFACPSKVSGISWAERCHASFASTWAGPSDRYADQTTIKPRCTAAPEPILGPFLNGPTLLDGFKTEG